jgi:hypothetical protein
VAARIEPVCIILTVRYLREGRREAGRANGNSIADVGQPASSTTDRGLKELRTNLSFETKIHDHTLSIALKALASSVQ